MNSANAGGQRCCMSPVFEAINAIDKRYTPYKLNLFADRGTSREAAASSAAHDILVALFPIIRPTSRDACRIVAAIAEAMPVERHRARQGRPRPKSLRCAPMTATTRRRAIAADLARRLRAHDRPGRVDGGKDDAVGDAVGLAFPSRAAAGADVGRLDARPQEIREIGSLNSSKRSAEQTTIGRFWFFTGPRTYNPIVRQIATARNMDLVDCARLYALTAMAATTRSSRCSTANTPVISGVRSLLSATPISPNPGTPREASGCRLDDADAPGISLRALHCRFRRLQRPAGRRGERDGLVR